MSGPFGSSQWMYKSGDYEIDNSLRIGSAAASGLARFGNDSRNGDIFTISFWVKRSILGTAQILVTSKLENSGVNSFIMTFTSADKIQVLGQPEDGTTGADSNRTAILTTAVFRDTSAWYHIVYRQDTTQGTASNRHKLYVNGVLQSLSTNNALDQNTEWKYFYNANNYPYAIANDERDDAYADFYMAEHHYTDGVSNGPEAFGETGDYGEWKPILYSGSHGTYGHYLKLNQTGAGSGTTAVGGHDYVTGTSSTIGADSSGNDNHFHIQGYGTHDHMLDSPTNNFPTWNPLSSNALPTLLEGNLKNGGENNKAIAGTFGVSTGKWYWEINVLNNSQVAPYIGVTKFSMENDPDEAPTLAATSGRSVYRIQGTPVYNNFTATAYANDSAHGLADYGILGLALDLDGGSLKYFFANTLYHTDSTIPSDGTTVHPFLTGTFAGDNGWNTAVANFGQDSSFAGNATAQGNQDGNDIGDFFYAPPSGYLALCTSNLPEPAVIPSEHFNTVLYTGNQNANLAITGVGFQPDMVWGKNRASDSNHWLFDSIRGATKMLAPDLEQDEEDQSGVTAFGSDGFTLGQWIGSTKTNDAYCAWNWKAGGGASSVGSNTDGSINTTDTSVNTTAGFSISTFTGNATSGATVGHGLGVAPEFVMVVCRSTAGNWNVYHASNTAAPETDYLALEVTGATADQENIWNDTAPTSSVFSLGNNASVNGNNATFLAICWHSVDGFSKFGGYTGNNSANGTFAYTGFRPAWLMIKRTNASGEWDMFDNKRSPHNLVNVFLKAEASGAEATGTSVVCDFTSNGFKIRGTDSSLNADGAPYIYLAFAETPFKFSSAR